MLEIRESCAQIRQSGLPKACQDIFFDKSECTKIILSQKDVCGGYCLKVSRLSLLFTILKYNGGRITKMNSKYQLSRPNLLSLNPAAI